MVVRAQDCSISFTTPQFAVQQELDILYGSGIRYNGATQQLRLNLFKPIGDGQTERPLIVMVHGGGFTGGDRNDLNALCQEYASMGWAAATISYRLDFYGTWLLSSPFAYDPSEVVRAAYRAQQDTRGALRFLKARSTTDSTSNENVVTLGFSAGAISVLHAAFVDDPSEKPASCGAIGSVQHFLSTYPRPDLGPITGNLNLNGQSDDVLAVVSYYGGLLDTTLVTDPIDAALYLYHQSGDPVVGCNYRKGLWGMPLSVGDNYPYLYGSCVIDPRIQHLGPEPGRYFYHPHVGGEHALHDPPAIYAETREFLRPLFCSPIVPPMLIAARVMLDGPYDANTGMMNDALRSLGTFPLMDPYPGLGYLHTGAGNGGSVAPAVIAAGGDDAIVDWVLMELRDANDATEVVASRSVLVQRDGDVVDLDGISPVSFDVPAADYHISLRHRNHLGIMTTAPVAVNTTPLGLDLTDAQTSTFGTNAQKSVFGTFPAEVMWAGDVNFDGELIYTGNGNDRDLILFAIGGVIPTNSVNGYRAEDVDLDGSVIYTGQNNDRDIILQNIGGVVPTNTRVEQLP